MCPAALLVQTITLLKNHLNTTIGRIRTFLGDQTADHYNDMIESYNSFIGSVNRLI